MKRNSVLKTLWYAGLILLLVISVAGCGVVDPLPSGDQPRYPTDYDPNQDSWTQIDPGDEDVSITWFMDYNYSDQNLADLIYRRTGVRVNFQGAMTDDHTELNNYIAGGNLPDIITIEDTSLRLQLAEEGYCYSIDQLAEWYAPSLLNRISDEYMEYYKGSDGHLYSMASHFYNDADIQEFEEIGGNQYANLDIIVRKDYLDAYIAYRTGLDASFDPDAVITKPSGFLEMCEWAKETYKLPNTNPTVCLFPFRTTAINDIFQYSLTCLMEFMGVPYEDADGNFVYQFDTPEFVEVLEFMNALYGKRLVTSANFSWDYAEIQTQVLNGRPVAVIGASQSIAPYLARREMDGYDATTDTVDAAYEYVSIIMTNEEGDAPLLMDYAGRGWRQTMITKNCEREDRVIKVLDYLASEQGMREMTYGETEGEYYEFKIRPGEINPRNNKPSTYGVIELTEKGKAFVHTAFQVHPDSVGLHRTHPLYNMLYFRMVSERDDYAGILAPYDWVEYKNKKTYFGYTFSRVPFRYPLDSSDRVALIQYADQLADVEAVWIEALPQMIMAGSREELMQIYENALALSYEQGAAEMTAFRNKCFLAYKEELGIEWAWPKNDPNYVAPEVKLLGNADQYATRPDYVYSY